MGNRELKKNNEYKYGVFIGDKMYDETVIWYETEDEAKKSYQEELAKITIDEWHTADRETVALVQVLEMQDIIYEPCPRDLWKQSIGKS